MKTKFIILLAVLAVNFTMGVANNNSAITLHRPVELDLSTIVSKIMPVAPQEATFDDGLEVYTMSNNAIELAPVTPKDADFDENVPEPAANYLLLAPTTPKEATFEDESMTDKSNQVTEVNIEAPSTPKEADFNDSDPDSLLFNIKPHAVPCVAGFQDTY
jgi:hypothetical protein